MTNQIQSLPLNSFKIDLNLSGRTEKEIATNAAELAPIMAAAGKWLESEPGEFFLRNGEKHLRTGFTRREAAIKNGWTEGLFVEVEDDALSNLLACVRTNTGRPLTPHSQGLIYIKLRDGQKPEDVEVGESVREPMPIKDIAKLIGKSFVWISQAISIAESTPEIGKLILEDKISAGVAIKAKQICKDDKKRFEMLEDAYDAAVRDGKSRASESHLDAVKHNYLPKPKAVEEPKKLVIPATVTPPNISGETKIEPIALDPLPEFSVPTVTIDGGHVGSELPLETATVTEKTVKSLYPKFRQILQDFTNDENPQIDMNDGQIHRLSQLLAAATITTESPF